MYKSKLNELCQKKEWGSPIYSCIKDGQDHDPLFKASVVVNGFTFVSPTISKSSKSAHNDAAKLALSHFTTSSKEEVPTTDVQKIKTLKVPAKSSSSDLDTGILSETHDFGSPTLLEDKALGKPRVTTTPDLSALSITEPNPEKRVDSYLLCNKVRVHTSIPNMDLPKGTVVLPIGDDKWTVVSLEFA